MEYAIRALDDEKSKKNDQMKSVDDELAEGRWTVTGCNVIPVH
jgi:hypothetical protein